MSPALATMSLRPARSILRCSADSLRPLVQLSNDRRTKHTSRTSPNGGPLKGVFILDLTRVLAGPFCTQILADYGADVIKIEHPDGGDDTRSWRTAGEQAIWKKDIKPKSAYFTTINRNKQSLTLNLKAPKGREILLELVKQADVVVDNFVPGKMEELGIGYQQLCKMNPTIIHASISGYGGGGPYAKRAGYDVIAAAEGGLLHITGEPDGRPMKPGLGLTDMCTGLYMHGAVLAALRARDITGEGQRSITVRNTARRWGTGHPSIVPYDCFKTSDAHLVVGAVNNRQFAKLCRLIENEDLLADDRFVDNDSRVRNRASLHQILDQTFSTKTCDEWMSIFEGSGMPYGPINTMQKVFKHPQALARDMVATVEDDAAESGAVKVLGIPVKFSHHKPSIRRKAPHLGEHTEEILTGLGHEPDEIADLRRESII